VIDGIVVVLHFLVSVALIALILLHAGRGGGLSDVFGGGMGPGGIGGSSVVERNLDRLTIAASLVFAGTTIALTWLWN